MDISKSIMGPTPTSISNASNAPTEAGPAHDSIELLATTSTSNPSLNNRLGLVTEEKPRWPYGYPSQHNPDYLSLSEAYDYMIDLSPNKGYHDYDPEVRPYLIEMGKLFQGGTINPSTMSEDVLVRAGKEFLRDAWLKGEGLFLDPTRIPRPRETVWKEMPWRDLILDELYEDDRPFGHKAYREIQLSVSLAIDLPDSAYGNRLLKTNIIPSLPPSDSIVAKPFSDSYNRLVLAQYSDTLHPALLAHQYGDAISSPFEIWMARFPFHDARLTSTWWQQLCDAEDGSSI